MRLTQRNPLPPGREVPADQGGHLRHVLAGTCVVLNQLIDQLAFHKRPDTLNTLKLNSGRLLGFVPGPAYRATRPPGHRATWPPGPGHWATRPPRPSGPGHRATGPSR
eukprot:200696-Chlamydomonas_euryale.AAC.2